MWSPAQRGSELAAEPLDRVHLDDDPALEVLAGVHTQELVGRPREAVRAGVGAATVGVDREAKRHPRRLGHAVHDPLRPDVEVLDVVQVPAIAPAVGLRKEGRLLDAHRRSLSNIRSVRESSTLRAMLFPKRLWPGIADGPSRWPFGAGSGRGHGPAPAPHAGGIVEIDTVTLVDRREYHGRPCPPRGSRRRRRDPGDPRPALGDALPDRVPLRRGRSPDRAAGGRPPARLRPGPSSRPSSSASTGQPSAGRGRSRRCG